MAGSPLHHALQAAESIVDQLTASDTFSIVTDDDKVDTVVPSQSVTDRVLPSHQVVLTVNCANRSRMPI
jgi:secreted protein with Ig-like and vWFA domain